MRKMFAILAVIASCAVRPAFAAVTAEIKLAEDGSRLYASVRVHGVEAGQVIEGVHIVWSHPAVEYTNKKGEVTKLFTDGGSVPAKGAWAIGDKDSRCFCKDTKETGCWRTHADFLVEYKLDNGKTVRAVGVWHVELVNGNGEAMGSADYTVK